MSCWCPIRERKKANQDLPRARAGRTARGTRKLWGDGNLYLGCAVCLHSGDGNPGIKFIKLYTREGAPSVSLGTGQPLRGVSMHTMNIEGHFLRPLHYTCLLIPTAKVSRGGHSMPCLPFHSAHRAACLGVYHTGTGPCTMKSRAVGIDHEREHGKSGCGTFAKCLETSGRARVAWECLSVEASGMAGLVWWKEGRIGELVLKVLFSLS